MQLDFTGKTVLVVGGSSGIGKATAQAFLKNGAEVHVWGTRACAADYAGEEGSELGGLIYRQVDITNIAAIEAPDPGLTRLDVLVQSQGDRALSAPRVSSARFPTGARRQPDQPHCLRQPISRRAGRWRCGAEPR